MYPGNGSGGPRGVSRRVFAQGHLGFNDRVTSLLPPASAAKQWCGPRASSPKATLSRCEISSSILQHGIRSGDMYVIQRKRVLLYYWKLCSCCVHGASTRVENTDPENSLSSWQVFAVGNYDHRTRKGPETSSFLNLTVLTEKCLYTRLLESSGANMKEGEGEGRATWTPDDSCESLMKGLTSVHTPCPHISYEPFELTPKQRLACNVLMFLVVVQILPTFRKHHRSFGQIL